MWLAKLNLSDEVILFHRDQARFGNSSNLLTKKVSSINHIFGSQTISMRFEIHKKYNCSDFIPVNGSDILN